MEVKPFLISISPDEYLAARISSFRTACAGYIGTFPCLQSEPYLPAGLIKEPLNVPVQGKSVVERYLDVVVNDVLQINTVELTVTGFNYFVHNTNSRTIYAAFDLSEDTMDFFYKIRNVLKNDKPVIPHIIIAEKIPAEAFNKAWPYFERLQFQYSFVPDGLTVMTKERIDSKTPYVFFKQLLFGPLNVAVY